MAGFAKNSGCGGDEDGVAAPLFRHQVQKLAGAEKSGRENAIQRLAPLAE